MASATQSQKRSKSGRFIKGNELNRRKLCAEKLPWNLVCDKEYSTSLSQSILFIRWILGAFIIGGLSDKFGRKRIRELKLNDNYDCIFPAVFCVVSTSFASSFASVLWLFLALRGITGFFQGGVYITLYVLTTEFVGPMHRNIAGTLVWMFYTSSPIVLSGLAYGIRNWRNLSIVISAPAFPLLLLWWWVPESCRWLLVHNKEKEAREVFLSIAAVNKGKISENKILCLENKVELRREERGIIDLVRSRKQLIKTSILWFTWFTNSMVYYGVLLSVGVLGGNLYLNFFLTSLIDIPSNFFVIWFMDW
ncbi:solute carrier family 22 member 3-like [Acropora millepora]|uniref:solute carrier family 22 member 3-like n=1 Tax=Acropora millepora TaxID=45264 RepID=UPI001CF23350|nr:solute carrier family 22 member 3-like [Acropora millepora]